MVSIIKTTEKYFQTSYQKLNFAVHSSALFVHTLPETRLEKEAMNWYALYTKPRWERKVASRLEELDIQTYCPVATEVRQWSDRKKKVTTPLFKSYVFVKLNEKDRGKVFDVPGVVQYIFWLGKPAIIRDAEIETIQKWLEDDRVEEVDVSDLTPGDKITVAGGSFKGQQAVVQKVGKKRLKLVLQSLGMVVNVRTSEAIS
ncbi:UpxY family transcription antiterminator [Salinimicrobium soli]|uniref:UpxY family transcription antiterminator n=1 Tax=Salinimicrobium soli TaxID=1254399 RepID=UPI003AAAD6DF